MNEHSFPEAAPDAEEQVVILTVSSAEAGGRLDKYLSEACDMTRAAVTRLIESGGVLLTTGAGKGTKSVTPDKNTKVKAGDTLTVTIPEPEDYDVTAENIPLDVIYEDGDIIVVNKPTGMVVHPAPGNYTGTLVNALLYHCGSSLSGVGGVKRPGIVHRIDKDTSGLLVVAKHDDAHNALSAQLKTHTVSRVYHAVCIGNLKEDTGTLTYPIGRNPTDRKKMAAFPVGTPTGDSGGAIRTAVTHYTVLERFPTGAKWGQAFTYVKCELETGRTHQIRVHMAATGHPLLGDPLYGGEGTKLGRSVGGLICGQMLHAKELRLIHPRTGEAMRFVCDLPADFDAVLTRLRKETDL
ncbi:MAG: RluA family pseudouridine synthase [Ruminococcaceae bacterium]|nr:RluA family pseudouridine synthase [Oscillospiraceae bacterium]